MRVPVIAFFNNKGGVGKTTLVYHLAWMYHDLGLRVVAVDLDPQANLTAAFLEFEQLEKLWLSNTLTNTVFRCVAPLIRGTGDIAKPHLQKIKPRLSLLVGDLLLSSFEGLLATEWSGCIDSKERSFRIVSAFGRLLQESMYSCNADVILMDLGPNLGSINRAALIAADYIVVPLTPDLFSLQGLKNLGPTLRQWKFEWHERIKRNVVADLLLPRGLMRPIGYVLLQHQEAANRPIKAYHQWIARIPNTYRQAVLNQPIEENLIVNDDPHCLTLLKHYKSLMPLAQEARKPVFHLTGADGVKGANIQAVEHARQDFEQLARNISKNCKASRANPKPVK